LSKRPGNVGYSAAIARTLQQHLHVGNSAENDQC
jgi:hypothetical protein